MSQHRRGGTPSQVQPVEVKPLNSAPSGVRRRAAARYLNAGYVLGLQRSTTSAGFGFLPASKRRPQRSKLIRHKGEFHAMVVGATGRGKGVGVIVPNGLLHPGQLICIDPKQGENAQIIARRRREMGDRVVILDPFRAMGPTSDALNPFDILNLRTAIPPHIDDVAELIASDLGHGHQGKDAYWWFTSTALLGGLCAYAMGQPDPARRTLHTVIDLLTGDDVTYNLAVLLDTKGKSMNRFAYNRIAEFLQIPDSTQGATRGCVLSTAHQMIHCLQAERVHQAIGCSTFDLNLLLDGDSPLSVFIVFPPNRLASHAGLLRMWLSTLVHVLTSRTTVPDRRTLLIVDEAANLKLDALPMLYSYGRGFGVSCLTAWQSLGQMMDTFGGGRWRTIAENAIIHVLPLHTTAVEPMAQFLGVASETIRTLRPDEQLVTPPSGIPEVLGRVDYRTHPLLSLMADINPRYVPRPSVGNSATL